ncbi:MAG: hypothetical protein M9939_01690 [Mesorhizobium sp.]|nr:hypothetical protein [Mesorhizobium sp.]MCO5159822.1 hypothetical protein [Mesorhizobium sp.]
MSRLAPDPVVVHLDGDAVVLRPTLRAAYRLNRRDGGFPALSQGVLDGDMGALADVIEEGAGRPTAIADLLKDVAINGVERLAELREPLLEYLAQLLGLDDAKPTDQPADTNAPTMSRTEYLERLFQIGTGNLGWTPADTWAASPAEIEAAFKGRCDLLRSIFGGGDDQARAENKVPMSKRVAATMKALGAKVVKREKAST